MRATAARAELAAAAKWVSRAISKNPKLPVLLGVVVEVTDDQVTLSATDFDLHLTASVPAMVQETGKALIPGRALTAYLGAASGEHAELALSDQLDITVGRSRAGFRLLDLEDYPQITDPADQSLGSVPVEDLRDALEAVSGLAERNSDHAWATGVQLVSSAGELTLTTGSPYALGQISFTTELADARILVGADELVSILRDLSGDMELSFDGANLGVQTSARAAVIRTISGSEFPRDAAVQKLLTDRPETLSLSLSELQEAARLSLIASDRVLFDIEPDHLTVSSFKPEKGELRNSIDQQLTCDTSGSRQFAMAGKYLMPVLGALAADPVITFSPGHSPVTVTDGITRFVVMPIDPNRSTT